MTEDTDPGLAHLEHSRHPVAIVHEGFFVYANAAFLDRLGYRSFDDLQAVSLLDLVDDRDHVRLYEHLEKTKKAASSDRRHTESRLTLLRADGLPLGVELTSYRRRYAGEDCIQLDLRSRQDRSLGRTVGSLPWRFYLSLTFLLLFSVLPATLLLKLNIDNAPEVYFPADEPAVVLDRELRTRFPDDRVFVLLFEGIALFSDGFFSAYGELARTLEQLGAVDEVVAITNQDHISGSRDDFIVEPLVDVERLSESRPEQRQQRIHDDQLSGGLLAADDGSALAMIVIPAGANNSIERLALEDEILSAVKKAQLEGYLVAMAGQIRVDVAQLRSMLDDNMVFIPGTVATGLLMVWWLFRRRLAVILAGVAIGVVVNSTVAIYVILGQPFTLISSIIPPLLSALTVAALVHLFNGVYHASKRGLTGAERLARAISEVGRPALYAALTTAGGLASLTTSPIIPIRTFGVVSALGTLLIYFVVFHILPTLLIRWDVHHWPTPRGGAQLVDRTVSILFRFAVRHPIAVVGGVLVLLALGTPQIGNVVVETNLQEFFEADHPVRQDTQLIDEKIAGTMAASVIFNVAERDGLKQAETLATIDEFQRWAEAQPEIDRSFGLPDFIKEMHWAFNSEDPAFRALPDDTELISQYLLIYDGDDIHDFVDRDYQHSQIALNLNVHRAGEISRVLQRIREYLGGNIGEEVDWEIAGNARLFSDIEDLLISGQVYSLWGALILIFAFMYLFLRSFGAAALCMIPNLSPILLIFIVMGAFGIWLDMATAMIASVAVGIAVDDTIHVYHGFRRRLLRGISPVVALARSYREAGRAIAVTTTILSAQFLILIWSDFVPTRHFGLLTTIGLIAALLFDLLLLPALLIILHSPRSPIAAWISHRTRGRARPGAGERNTVGPGFDEDYWTSDRKTALVRELISGRYSVASAAEAFALPPAEVENWLHLAEQAMKDALGGGAQHTTRDPAKVRALAKAYKKLRAENRKLKERQPLE